MGEPAINEIEKTETELLISEPRTYCTRALLRVKGDHAELLLSETNGACLGLSLSRTDMRAMRDWLTEQLAERA